jgi:hypothetical protein
MLLFPSIAISNIAVPDYIKGRVLKSRGVDVEGRVERLYITKGKGGSSAYHVNYMYQPREMALSRYPLARRTEAVSRDDYYSLSVGGALPVIYDPLAPESSFLNFHDTIRKNNPSKRVKFFIVITALLMFFAMGVVLKFFIFPALKEKRLLGFGNVAPATIVGEEEYETKRGWRSKVSYCFVDAGGNAVSGMRKGLPSGVASSGADLAERIQILDNPTVLYDPRNSARNILYPPLWAELV